MITIWRGKRRKARNGEGGFTLVELVMVLVISTIMVAGMVGMVFMAMNHFSTHRDLQAVTDNLRRLLSSMSRQLKDALQFENVNCTTTKVTFWGDIDDDNPNASVSGYDYEEAEIVSWELNGNVVEQSTTQAVGDPDNATGLPLTTTTGIASSVTALTFTYYDKIGGSEMDPPENYDINKNAGRINISVTVQKGNISRSFEQDVFLRIFDRIPEGTWCTITGVVPGFGSRGATLNVNITAMGTHFEAGVSQANFGSGITVNSTTVVDDDHCTANITIQGAATLGIRDVGVRTGQEDAAPLVGGFDVRP